MIGKPGNTATQLNDLSNKITSKNRSIAKGV